MNKKETLVSKRGFLFFNKPLYYKKKLMFLYYTFGIMFGLIGLLIVGEVIATKLPNTWFSGWWRRNIMAECQECD